MCELLQGYRVWTNEILSALEDICEGVVPAGHLDDSIYWRTKRLYEDAWQLHFEGRTQELENLLDVYRKDGQQLLEQLGQARCEAQKAAAKLPLDEEKRIRLRRTYANDILNSLQMFVNLTFLMSEYSDYRVSEVAAIFELGAEYQVKRVRSGVVVETAGRQVLLVRQGQSA